MFNLSKDFPLALDINDFSIEVLQFSKRLGEVNLNKHGRIRLEEGIVKQGRILDEEKFKEKLSELLKNIGFENFKNKKVVFSLPEAKTFLHLFELPSEISGKELLSAVEGQAAKTIPIDSKEIYFDFQVISKKEKLQEILYVSSKKETVEQYIKVLKEIGFKPIALDIESASLGRVFSKEAVSNAALLIIDIGARNSVLTVFDRGFIRMSSIIPVGGNYFTNKIAEKLSISFEEAEKMKKDYGLSGEGEEGRVVLILQDVIDDILKEAKNLIAYYKDKKERDVAKIILCGGSSLMPAVTSYFQSNLGIETKIGNPSSAFPKLKKEKDVFTVLYSNALGLSLRALEADPETAGINLIPPEKRPQQPKFVKREVSKNKAFNYLAFAALMSALIFLAFVIYNYILKPTGNEKTKIIPQTETPGEQSEKETAELKIPSSFMPFDTIIILEVQERTEIPGMLSAFLQEQRPENEYARILVKNTEENEFFSRQDFLASFDIKMPDNFYDYSGRDFSFFIFNQKEGKRTGFIINIEDKQGLEELLKAWEVSMENDFDNLFAIFGKEGKALVSYFKNASYREQTVRYQTFSKNDVGICYSFLGDYLIFTSSFSGMKETIDRAQSVLNPL